MENYVASELAVSFLKSCDVLGLKVSKDKKSKNNVKLTGDPERVNPMLAQLQALPDLEAEVLRRMDDKETKAEALHSFEYVAHHLADVAGDLEGKIDPIVEALNKVSDALQEIQGTLNDLTGDLLYKIGAEDE